MKRPKHAARPFITTTAICLREGVVTGCNTANTFKPALCIGYADKPRALVRLYRAQTDKWSSPAWVNTKKLRTLQQIDIEGPSRRHDLLTRALKALRDSPKIGFSSGQVALLVSEDFRSASQNPGNVTKYNPLKVP